MPDGDRRRRRARLLRTHCIASCTATAVCATARVPQQPPAAHPADRVRAPRCPNQSPGYHANVSDTRSPFSPGRAVSCITLVLALEAQLPTGCHSRSTRRGASLALALEAQGTNRHSRRGGRARRIVSSSHASVEAAGAVDAQNASTAPWKTHRARFPQLPQTSCPQANVKGRVRRRSRTCACCNQNPEPRFPAPSSGSQSSVCPAASPRAWLAEVI